MKLVFSVLMFLMALVAVAEGPTQYQDMWTGSYGRLPWATTEWDASVAAYEAAHVPASSETTVLLPSFLVATGTAATFAPQVEYVEVSDLMSLSTLIRPGLMLMVR